MGKVIGENGADGNGIVSIELLSTSGRVKTYRINFDDGDHFDYQVTDGSDATVTIDAALSSTSTNPVQNKVINTALGNKVNTSDIVDNLTTNNANKVLSAKQGYQLNQLIGSAIIYIVGSGN